MAERILVTEPVKWEIPPDFGGIMGYNPRHDIQDYLNLKALEGKVDVYEFARLQIQLNTRIKRQIEKAIGERFSVEKSPIEYFVKDGRLMSPDYDRPVVDQYKIGQEFLASEGSLETEREKAEVAGIAKVEKIFSEDELNPELSVILISPQGPEGSLYTDNCFDVYSRSFNGKIGMVRYYSSLSWEEFASALQRLEPDLQKPQALTDAYFLGKPVMTTSAKEEILSSLGIESKTTPYDQYQRLLNLTHGYTNAYLKLLNSIDLETFGPKIVNEVKISINAIFNASDRAKNMQFHYPASFAPQVRDIKQEAVFLLGHPQFLGRQEVRVTTSGCPGGQRGFSISQPSALAKLASAINGTSVLDFANYLTRNSSEKVEDFQCPGTKKDGSKCTYVVRAYSGVKKCPECGMEATCA